MKNKKTSEKWGDKVIEGKTKIVLRNRKNPTEVILKSKNDITAGDGKRHDVVSGKGAMSNCITCNVFELLKACSIPVAYKRKLSDTEFLADFVNMIPIEVVWRRSAVGSKREREPFIPNRHVFARSVVEMHLKTSNKRWNKDSLVADDPLMKIEGKEVHLFDPHKPIHGQKPFLIIALSEVIGDRDPKVIGEIETLARKSFLALEQAYRLQNFDIVDGKEEMGFTLDGRLVIADVIDAESIRLTRDGKSFDKQPYRDSGWNPEFMNRFGEVLKATEAFRIPRQRIIIWAGSKADDISDFVKAIEKLSEGRIKYVAVARSIHKESEQGLYELRKLIQEVPLSVIVLAIGMSNGAGPVVSAHTGVPALTCPMNYEDHPEDVYSSLRTPSNVPIATILKPANAVLQALQILAQNNPQLYSILQFELETRMFNTVPI
jgi:phosphoribosylaminoimidazole carboxylase/phosphoribosylaminoimidazole-succinocarboxamide synthase